LHNQAIVLKVVNYAEKAELIDIIKAPQEAN
jgi:hypothetical protein